MSVLYWCVRWTCSGSRCLLRAGPLLWTASWGRESTYSACTSTVCLMVNRWPYVILGLVMAWISFHALFSECTTRWQRSTVQCTFSTGHYYIQECIIFSTCLDLLNHFLLIDDDRVKKQFFEIFCAFMLNRKLKQIDWPPTSGRAWRYPTKGGEQEPTNNLLIFQNFRVESREQLRMGVNPKKTFHFSEGIWRLSKWILNVN